MHGLRIFSDAYQDVSLEGHLEIFWGKTLPQLLEKWFPLQGERAHSQTPISIQIKSKSIFSLLSSSVSRANLSCVVATIFFSLAFLSSSVSMASRLVATIFSSLAFLYLSVSMANLNRLVAASFFSLALLSFSVSTANFVC